MNNRVLKYVVGLGLFMSVSLLHAGTQRSIGQQSKAGVKALNEHAATQADAVRSAKEVERIKREQAAKERASQSATTEELDLSADSVLPAGEQGSERLVSTNPTAPVADGTIPGVTYGAKAAAYQTAIVAALNDVVTNDVAIVDVADAGLGADLIKLTAGLVTAPASKDPTVVLHDAIVTVLGGNNQEAAIRLAFTLAALKAAPGVAAAGISDVLLASIVADVQNVFLVTIGAGVATPTFPAGGIHVNTLVAAAAFGVQFADGAWKVKRSLSLTNIPGTADVLHFHEGDFHPEAGFFMGLDATGNYAGLSADNQKYALSRVDLTPNGYAVPPVTPIAPAEVALNAKAGKTPNPIHGKGLTHLLLGAGQKPVVVTANDQTHVHMVANYVDGSEVLTTADAANPVGVPFPLKDASNTVLDNATGAKIFDIATTTKPTQFSATVPAPKNLIFAAVADKPDLLAATVANTGIAVMSVEADHLAPLNTGATNAPGGAVNTAKLLPLTQVGGVLAATHDAAFADAGDINLWYDDRYRQVFGTVAGIKPGNVNQDVAYGLFHGMWDGVGDTFVLKPMIDVAAHGKILAGSEKKVAASIFGAQVDTGYADVKTGKPVVNLYRPRTMHTSTDKNYLLVTGGVQTQNYKASRAWVNALPLIAPAAPGNPHVGGAGDLAQIGDITKPIAAAADAPAVDRQLAKSDIIDASTPFIVGRFPSFLAPVAGDLLQAGDKRVDPGQNAVYQDGAILAPGSIIESSVAKPAQLRGRVSFAAAAAGDGTVALAADTPVAAGVTLLADTTFDQHFALGVGTKIGQGSKFSGATDLVAGDLQVNVQPITVQQNSVLAAGSQLKNATTLAAQEVLGVGAVTNFNLGSTIAAGSILTKDSVINQATNALTVGAGGVVNFDPAEANKISMQAVTDLKMQALVKSAGLHNAEENVAHTAVELLKAEADGFAQAYGFINNPGLGGFKRIGIDYVGALGDTDFKGVARNAAGAITPIFNGGGTGRKALQNLSTVIMDDYAGHPTLSRGFQVADAIMQSAGNGDATAQVYAAGLTKVKDITGIDTDDKNTNIPVIDYGLKFATSEKITNAGLRATVVNVHGTAGMKKVLEVGAHGTRNAVIRDPLRLTMANALTKGQSLTYAACMVLADAANGATCNLFKDVAHDPVQSGNLIAAHGDATVAAGAANVALVANPLAMALLALAPTDNAGKDIHTASLLFTASYLQGLADFVMDAPTLAAFRVVALDPALTAVLHTAITDMGGQWAILSGAPDGAGGANAARDALNALVGHVPDTEAFIAALAAIAQAGRAAVMANVVLFVNAVNPLLAHINATQTNLVHCAEVGKHAASCGLLKAIGGDAVAVNELTTLFQLANGGSVAALGAVAAGGGAADAAKAALMSVRGNANLVAAITALEAADPHGLANVALAAVDPAGLAALKFTGTANLALALLGVPNASLTAVEADPAAPGILRALTGVEPVPALVPPTPVGAAPHNPAAIVALVGLAHHHGSGDLLRAIAADGAAIAALNAIGVDAVALDWLLNLAHAAPGLAGNAAAGLRALDAVADAKIAMALFGGDVASILAAAASAGGNDPAGGLDTVTAAIDEEIKILTPKLAAEEKLIVSLAKSAVAAPVGDYAVQRRMLANGIEAAYKDSKDSLKATWSSADVLAALPNDVVPGRPRWVLDTNTAWKKVPDETKLALGLLDAFKKNIVGGYKAGGPAFGDDREKLSTIFDTSKVAIYDKGNDKRYDVPATLKAMVAQALAANYYDTDKTMQVLQKAIDEGGGEGFKRVGGSSPKRMAHNAILKHIQNHQGLGPLSDDEKYLEKYAGATDPLTQTAGVNNILYGKYADAPYNDSGAAVLKAVSDALFQSKNVVPGVPVGVADMKNQLPFFAYRAIAALPDAAVPAPGNEFLAGRSAIEFAPQTDFPITAAHTVIGSGSELRGVTVTAANDVWQFGAGVTLPAGTTLPAWTLFKKGANADYRGGGLQGFEAAADAIGAPVAGTPWGGQWVLGNITNLGIDRAKLAVAGVDLKLSSIDDGIKIAADRKIKSNNGAAVAAHEKYTLHLPAGTLLPAGTKIYNLTAGMYSTDLQAHFANNAALFDFAGGALRDIPLAGFKELPDDVTVGAVPYAWPDELAIEFPEYPTKLAAGAVLPAGTRVKNIAVGASDQSGLIHDAVGPIVGLNFANANDYFTLPSNGTVQGAGIDGVANLQIDHDPLFTKGIIRGSFNPVSKLTQQYKPNVDLTLAKWTPQRFAPGTVLPINALIEPAVIYPAVAGDEVYVNDKIVGYNGSLAKGSLLAPLTAFAGQAVKVEVDLLELDGEWNLRQNLVLPPGTAITMLGGYQRNWENAIKAIAADGVTLATLPNLNQAGAPLAAPLLLDVAGIDATGGYKIDGGDLHFGGAANNKIKIEVPANGVIKGVWSRVGAEPAKLTAKVSFESSGAALSNGVAIHAGSVLAKNTQFQTGTKVLDTANLAAPYLGGALQMIQTSGDPAGGLKIMNKTGLPEAGSVTVLSGVNKLALTNAGGITGKYSKVTVGAEPLDALAGNLVVGAGGVHVAGGSTLAANTLFDNVTLGAPLKVSNPAGQALANTSVIQHGSHITVNTEVIGAGGELEVVVAALKLSADNALKCDKTTLAGVTKADGAVSTLTIPAGAAGIMVPDAPAVTWDLAPGKIITTNDKTSIIVGNGGQLTLGENSLIKDGSNIVTTESGYAVSATDMQVIGDSVYIGLEGDRSEANGIEAGVFKSTALFNSEGVIRGWTPWQRVGANGDATAFFGYNSNTGNLVYLTSPDGKAFNDTATGTLVNPATTVKLTQWGRGDNASGANSLHDGVSLAGRLATIFGNDSSGNSGVFGLFDFDPDTYCFRTANRRYEDPHISCMVATGNEKVALILTGKRFGNNFASIQKFDDSVVKTFGAAEGLAGLGRITCAEFTRNATTQNWLFVGGENGLAVLAKKIDGAGLLPQFDQTAFAGLGDYAFHKLLDPAGAPFKNVRRIVADENTQYVYVVTKDAVLRINPNAAFQNAAKAAGSGKLVHGALNAPASTYVKVAIAEKAKAYGAGGDDSLLSKGISATQAGEFTDLAILKSVNNATLDTNLMLATTNGLFVNAAVVGNAFDGDPARLTAVNWNKVETSAKQAAPYDGLDINARAGIVAAVGLANSYDGTADTILTVVGAAMDYALAPPGAAPGYGGLGLAEADARLLARDVAKQLGAPALIVDDAAFDALVTVEANAIGAVGGGGGILGAMRGAAGLESAADWAEYDDATKLMVAVMPVIADIIANGHAGGMVAAAIAALPLGVRLVAIRAAVEAIRVLPATMLQQQLADIQSAYGSRVAWLNVVIPALQRNTGAGLKTVLRLEPINLHSGGRMMTVANDHTFEGNINVYATDNANSELRLYRLDATGGTVKGIAEVTSNDIGKQALPYFARLGTVNADLIGDLNTNFFLKAVDASRVDDMIVSGGVSALVDPTKVVPAVASDQVLNVGGEYSGSLSVPQLSTVMNSASGAAYMPTNDGARVNE